MKSLFPAWFFVATHSSLLAVKLSSSLDVTAHSLLGKGEYYGISVPGSDSNFSNKVLCKIDNKIEIYDRSPSFSFVSATDVTTEHGSIHQVVHSNQNLYLTNTERNEIARVREKGGKAESKEIGDVREDVNHINSIHIREPYAFVVLRNHRAHLSELLVFQTDDRMSTVARGKLWHNYVHNVFPEKDKLYYNATIDRRLVRIDTRTGTVDATLRLPGHVKGMSVIGDLMLVGVSEPAGREDRPTATGHLAVVDRTEMRLMKLIDVNFDYFQKPSGNINEIRCVSGGERANVRNAPPAIDPSMMLLNGVGPIGEKWRLLFVGSVPETLRFWQKRSREFVQQSVGSFRTMS